jgi:transcriptional regulator with XRE-family HTH domain
MSIEKELKFMNQCHLLPMVARPQNDNNICGMTNKYLDTFGKRVRILRQERGWRQQDLVDALQDVGAAIGRTYVSEWERTEKTPTGDIVAALARVLDTTTDYLLLLTDDAERPGAVQDEVDAISEEAEEVAQVVDSMTPERRQDVLAIVRALHQEDSVESTALKRYDIIMERIRRRDGAQGVERAEELLRRFLDSLSGASAA